MLMLYKTLIRPILEYCVSVWRPHAKKDVLTLEKIQKRYTKIIDGCKRKSYSQRLEKLGITTIEERHQRADMIQVFKILNDGNKVYPEKFLKLSDRLGRNNSRKLFKGRNKLDIAKYSFTSKVVDSWNALPDAVVLSADVKAFKANYHHITRSSRGRQ